MVEVAATTQPEVQPDVGAHDQTGRRLAPHPKNASPMAATALYRQAPEVGVKCVNCARWDLSGVRSVMGVSTAIEACAEELMTYLGQSSGGGFNTSLMNITSM
jgi:hypothetical protein